MGERYQAISDKMWDKTELVGSVQKQHYITINEIIFTMCYLSQINIIHTSTAIQSTFIQYL